jgi:hypothetical protein
VKQIFTHHFSFVSRFPARSVVLRGVQSSYCRRRFGLAAVCVPLWFGARALLALCFDFFSFGEGGCRINSVLFLVIGLKDFEFF